MNNISWDNEDLGLSFEKAYGRITIFKTTIEALGYPANFRFLFDEDHKQFAIESCSYDACGSHTLAEIIPDETYQLKSMDLVQFIYHACDWDENYTYRIKGIIVPIRNMVIFDLSQAIKSKDLRELKMMEKAGS
ncbi:hypothetical protein [Ruminococcus flavefaciens]|uniref:hypothetical protein n=1 Tax=Ruminococcus flavefaciens TaxID=1265 RepID=UPI00048CBA09|nr:hypothetical protein [Ruminococcus flavefaciens]